MYIPTSIWISMYDRWVMAHWSVNELCFSCTNLVTAENYVSLTLRKHLIYVAHTLRKQPIYFALTLGKHPIRHQLPYLPLEASHLCCIYPQEAAHLYCTYPQEAPPQGSVHPMLCLTHHPGSHNCSMTALQNRRQRDSVSMIDQIT